LLETHYKDYITNFDQLDQVKKSLKVVAELLEEIKTTLEGTNTNLNTLALLASFDAKH
jgi:hypothetical protein